MLLWEDLGHVCNGSWPRVRLLSWGGALRGASAALGDALIYSVGWLFVSFTDQSIT
jgi:hypothetical protein